MALALHGDESWDKRNVVHLGDTGTWELTLDDTPGHDRRDENGDLDENGTYRKFNLEFNVHGGGGRKGFADNDLAGLLAAIASIEAYCKKALRDETIDKDAFGKPKGKLILFHPRVVPERANMQLTAGASLVGLHKLLAANNQMGGEGRPENKMSALAVGNDPEKMAKSYVSPDEIQQGIGDGPVLHEKAAQGLSAMLTLIKTFLDHYEEEKTNENPKEAALLLWKTPLTLFFQSRDLGPYKEAIEPRWLTLVDSVFQPYYEMAIDLVSDEDKERGVVVEEVPVMDWLRNLPTKDLLTDADQKYNESFGGLGVLEGGAKTYEAAASGKGSVGHPIFEFRSMPGNLEMFKSRLASVIDTLGTVNQD
jgi:hypothetical protein